MGGWVSSSSCILFPLCRRRVVFVHEHVPNRDLSQRPRGGVVRGGVAGGVGGGNDWRSGSASPGRLSTGTITGTCRHQDYQITRLPNCPRSGATTAARYGNILESLVLCVPFPCSAGRWGRGHPWRALIHSVATLRSGELGPCTRDAMLRDASRVVFACWQVWRRWAMANQGGRTPVLASLMHEMAWLVRVRVACLSNA